MTTYVQQHLIDPVACLRCGACYDLCDQGAVDFDGDNYIVDPELCTGARDCLAMCGTGAIDHWYAVPEGQRYSKADQVEWVKLPERIDLGAAQVKALGKDDPVDHIHPAPVSAATPASYLFTPESPIVARIVRNERVSDVDSEAEIRHIELDFSAAEFPWLEGQNIGVLAPGNDHHGHPHHARAYSIASDRNGEQPGSRVLALTVKRLVDEWEGEPYYGVASNYLCDRAPGDEVKCVGPMGERFLMPQDPDSRLLMISTGTGIAPMRGFIQRVQRKSQHFSQPMLLFYGGRKPTEMAYYEELLSLPAAIVETYMALSRSPDHPRRYVQHLMTDHAAKVAHLLTDGKCHIFVCGLLGMEQGVMDALAEICRQHAIDWSKLHEQMHLEGRLQIETY